MINRKLIAALVGLTLVGGTVAEASAKVVAQTGTKVVTTQTIGGKHLRKVAATQRFHVSRRAAPKHMKIVKLVHGKRIVVSHFAKRVAPKHV